MTARSCRCVTVHAVPIIIPISIHRKKSNSFPICAAAIPMQAWSSFWVKLMQRGYKRSIPGLYRFLKKQGIMAQKLLNPKYVPKPYEQMKYPGQRIQIDVKFVPVYCLVNEAKGKKFYQYTAINEYSR